MLTVSDGSAVNVDRVVVGDRGDGESGGTGLPILASPIWAVGGLVLLLVAVLALREVATLVLPVLVGLLIALVAWPMVGALERRGIRHGLALTGTITGVLAIVFLAAGIGALAVGELVVQVPRYESRLGAALPEFRDRLAQFGITVDLGAISAVISPERIVAFVQPVASAVSEAGGAMLVVAFTVIYALAGARFAPVSGHRGVRRGASIPAGRGPVRQGPATIPRRPDQARTVRRWTSLAPCRARRAATHPVGSARVHRELHPERRHRYRGHPADHPGLPRRQRWTGGRGGHRLWPRSTWSRTNSCSRWPWAASST